MPVINDLPSQSLLMSLGIAMIAVFLGLRQWYERRARDGNLSQADRGYFFRQDLRRGIGVGILLVVALGISAGSRVSPRAAGGVNRVFVDIWLFVLVLVAALLALALLDWFAIRTYAARQRQSMTRERLEMLGDSYREAAGQQTGNDSHEAPKRG
jgi:hypothetical protein